MTKIERWGQYEVNFEGPREGNPFIDITLSAEFRQGDRLVKVAGFYDGDGIYKVRFMPDATGSWTFTTSSNRSELNGRRGGFECVPASKTNHGPVRVKNQFHFAYADQTPYFPFGTTCYAWIHQAEELQEKTLETLRKAPFNKMRMCVFPKHYDYNHNEPELYPYEGSLKDGFDFKRPNPIFYRHLEKRILDLQSLGIECDLIIFHPYDRWGFSTMSAENDDLYLKYLIARLAAFRNIWWSLANEYDLMAKVIPADWERFGAIVRQEDPYNHLLSIHNCRRFYDYAKPWITHCSIQRLDVFKTSENTDKWRAQYGKPVIIDECAYEGNINHGWGNITGEEMTRRVWEGVLRGGYVGHGETYVHPQDILWWSHGGDLHGTSPERIGFLRKIVEDAPGPITPLERIPGEDVNWDVTVGLAGLGWRLYYFGFNQPTFRTFSMSKGKRYKIDVIDTWNMTIQTLLGVYQGDFRIDLPGRQYMAVRFTMAE